MTFEELNIIWLTIRVAAVSTVITVPLAVAAGYFFARKKFPFRPFFESLLSVTMVAPPVVTGYLLLLVFGREGFIGSALYRWFGLEFVFNFNALVIASVFITFPLAVRSIRSSFELVDPQYELVSSTLGAGGLSTFFRISLPLALPGIISGAVIAFARSIGEFGATITLAGNISGKTQTLALMVFTNMQIPGKEAQVFRMVMISLLISFAAIIISEYSIRKNKYYKS